MPEYFGGVQRGPRARSSGPIEVWRDQSPADGPSARPFHPGPTKCQLKINVHRLSSKTRGRQEFGCRTPKNHGRLGRKPSSGSESSLHSRSTGINRFDSHYNSTTVTSLMWAFSASVYYRSRPSFKTSRMFSRTNLRDRWSVNPVKRPDLENFIEHAVCISSSRTSPPHNQNPHGSGRRMQSTCSIPKRECSSNDTAFICFAGLEQSHPLTNPPYVLTPDRLNRPLDPYKFTYDRNECFHVHIRSYQDSKKVVRSCDRQGHRDADSNAKID
jgi:hypothetical protein